MKSVNTLLSISLVAVTSLFFNACGGSSGGGSSVPIDENTGYYLDSAVEGINYSCGSKSGITDENGMFYYEDNKSCDFSLSGLTLRTIEGSSLSKGVKIIEDNVSVARFLQSLDYDGIAGNGIELNTLVINKLNEYNLNILPQTDAEVQTIVNNLQSDLDSFSGDLVSLVDAKAHVDSTKALQEEEIETYMSLEGYLQKLIFRINPGFGFGWRTTSETTALENRLSSLNSDIAAAEIELADEDVSEYQSEIDSLYTNKDKMSTLISNLKSKAQELETAISRGDSVSNVNTLASEMRTLAKGELYDYFEDWSMYYLVPLPTLNAETGTILANVYMNKLGEHAWSFVDSLKRIDIRMQLLAKAYTDALQAAIKEAYDEQNSAPDSEMKCELSGYNNSVVLDAQVIGQCQMAYFYTCAIDKYSTENPDMVTEAQDRIQTYCDILDGYQEFTDDQSNPKLSCDYCSGY